MLVPQSKSSLVPVEDFEAIALSIAKNKQMALERTELHLFLHNAAQSRDSLSEVGIGAIKIDLMKAIKLQNHDASPVPERPRRSTQQLVGNRAQRQFR